VALVIQNLDLADRVNYYLDCWGSHLKYIQVMNEPELSSTWSVGSIFSDDEIITNFEQMYQIVQAHHLSVQLYTNFGIGYVLRSNVPIELSKNLDFVGFDVFMDSFLVLSPHFIQNLQQITHKDVVITEFGMSTSNSQTQSDFLIKGLTLFKTWILKVVGWFTGTALLTIMEFVVDPQSKRLVTGLQKMLIDNRVFNHLRNLRLVEKILIQGLILTVVLIAFQVQLDNVRHSFMSYMPPIGFALLIFTTYLVQPILLGALNIFIINTMFKTKGWQVGFWLNGIFLLLTFSTLNLVLQTALNLSFTYTAIIDLVVFAIPFGFIARFSNGGWKKPID
jgi:hypothetical protein